jgi:hypothetical protein
MNREFPDKFPLGDEQRELIKQLRDEVASLKECIARYSIQCLMFAGAALGIIVHEVKNTPAVVLASVPTLFLLRAVSRTAIHKLGTINRNHGYELHLQRTRRLPGSQYEWSPSYVAIGWEEAMRAWRVVQATLYKQICCEAHERFNWRGYWGKGYRKKFVPRLKSAGGQKYYWYDVSALVQEADSSATYHPGNYVRKMLDIIHYVMVGCIFVQVFALLMNGAELARVTSRPLWGLTLVGYYSSMQRLILVSAVLSAVFLLYAWRRDSVRLGQLEEGVLSIHSCAIVWHAVVIAHYRALVSWRHLRHEAKVEADAFNGYTYNLTLQAKSLAKDVFAIHRWIEGERSERSDKTRSDVRLSTASKSFESEGTILDCSVDGSGIGILLHKAIPTGMSLTSRMSVAIGNDTYEGICRHVTLDPPHRQPAEYAPDSAERRRVGIIFEGKERERFEKFVKAKAA